MISQSPAVSSIITALAILLRLALINEEYLHPMAELKENEEVNEELSSGELKSVSGGLSELLDYDSDYKASFAPVTSRHA